MDRELLRLFNGVFVEDGAQKRPMDENLFRWQIREGYLVDPKIPVCNTLLYEIDEVFGLDGEKANSTFHKSWSTIRSTPEEELAIHQMLHYLTTYGFEALGIFDSKFVYFPKESLEIKELAENYKFVYIRALTKQEIIENIKVLVGGVALHKNTLQDVYKIIVGLDVGKTIIEDIKNNELKAMVYKYLGTAPTDPVEFLRYIIYVLTGETLVIKNDNLISKLQFCEQRELDLLIEKAPSNLASIFYRYKPLFLAMKKASRNKRFFNRLRKDADKLHKPLPVNYLNDVINKIKKGVLDFKILEEEVSRASVFRKIKLLYALKFAYSNPSNLLFKIRNGKSWVVDSDYGFSRIEKHVIAESFNIVVQSIISDVKKNVKGKAIYIPNHIKYALPATEKQFTGNIPSNSYVSVDEDLMFGVHWYNGDRCRVDIDLSAIDETGNKIGWDSYYKTESNDFMYSGDVTDAPKPNGACEILYAKKLPQNPRIMYLNNFTYESEPAKAKIFIAKEKGDNIKQNYMVDQNNILLSANIEIAEAQMGIGLFVPGSESEVSKIYLNTTGIKGTRVSRHSELTTKTIQYLKNAAETTIILANILYEAGAVILDEPPKDGSEYIDLSPSAIDKTTILSFFAQ
jgi:hypothetical protein